MKKVNYLDAYFKDAFQCLDVAEDAVKTARNKLIDAQAEIEKKRLIDEGIKNIQFEAMTSRGNI